MHLSALQTKIEHCSCGGSAKGHPLQSDVADLQDGRDAQLALTPAGLSVPGLDVALSMRPARYLSGDYVDAVPLSDGRVMLIVADVCGKGVRAGLTAAALQGIVRGSALDDHPLVLRRLMRKLNKYVAANVDDCKFVTMLIVIVDTASGVIEHANAGHPPALVVNQSGELRDLSGGGESFPLGIDPEWEFTSGTAMLQPGEMIAMYSDGLTEASAASGGMIGLSGLRSALTTIHGACRDADLATTTHQMLEWFANASRGLLQEDDHALLLARRDRLAQTVAA